MIPSPSLLWRAHLIIGVDRGEQDRGDEFLRSQTSDSTFIFINTYPGSVPVSFRCYRRYSVNFRLLHGRSSRPMPTHRDGDSFVDSAFDHSANWGKDLQFATGSVIGGHGSALPLRRGLRCPVLNGLIDVLFFHASLPACRLVQARELEM